MKVTIVGAGNVGATCANVLANKSIASEIVLLDIQEGLAEGKAIDIMQCATHTGFNCQVIGVTNNYPLTAHSDVVVITSGVPRKPGMTREELIDINATIVQSVATNLISYSPNAIFINVSNPLDTMTYLTYKTLGIEKNRVIGMGGALDTARFKYYIAKQLNIAVNDVTAMVIGGHGDTTMIPLQRLANYKGISIAQTLSDNQLQEIVSHTMVGGATLTKLLGTSAWYAPGAAVATLVDAILNDHKKIIPCSVYLDGEYKQNDICIGVPCLIGKKGVEEIIDLQLTANEYDLFEKAAHSIRDMNQSLLKIIK